MGEAPGARATSTRILRGDVRSGRAWRAARQIRREHVSVHAQAPLGLRIKNRPEPPQMGEARGGARPEAMRAGYTAGWAHHWHRTADQIRISSAVGLRGVCLF